MASLLISAIHKSSGKTTVTIGLCAALRQQGFTVQAFKKGPDYIDALWLSEAAGRPCHNLDFHTMSHAEILATVARYTQHSDLAVIEGNMGLFDGVDVTGSNSNAALANLLNTPVVLVINTQGLTRTIAPLLLGLQQFDSTLSIAGVILNQVAGQRHESKLRAAIDYYTTIPVLGSLQRESASLVERHLGLMPSPEDEASQEKISHLAEKIKETVDLKKLYQLAQAAPELPPVSVTVSSKPPDVKIGVIRDAAFNFYYAGDLMALAQAGAELVFINSLTDNNLPPVDGLLIGGGFPETHAEQLAANHSFKQAIFQAIEQGLPCYAECGGLMYLARRLYWQGNSWEMVGILPFDTCMGEKPQGRGYVMLEETGDGLWPLQTVHGELMIFPAHEFHYSRVVQLPSHLQFAYRVKRGYGIDGQHDGVIYKNTLACYAHLRDVENNHWATRFVKFVRHTKNSTFSSSA